MNHHKLKLSARFFASVVDGSKSFEVRFNDRDYHVGDYLQLHEVDEDFIATGRVVSCAVSYVLTADQFPSGLQPNYVVLGLGRVPDSQPGQPAPDMTL